MGRVSFYFEWEGNRAKTAYHDCPSHKRSFVELVFKIHFPLLFPTQSQPCTKFSDTITSKRKGEKKKRKKEALIFFFFLQAILVLMWDTST